MKVLDKVETLFAEHVAHDMHNMITAYNGQEMFFGGFISPDKKIYELTLLSKGNRRMVPVVFDEAIKYDVIIHNHPDGILEPSDNDLEIASGTGNYGVGFYIVDNTLDSVNVIVAYKPKAEIYPLDVDKVSQYFSEDGDIAAVYPEYELRQSQVTMVQGVVKAYNENAVYVCEAGTGTGKSIAYLIPSYKWICENKEKVVISTNTINLQEQLISKDIPLLERIVKKKVNYALVKGRNNYLCMRKLKNLTYDKMTDTVTDHHDTLTYSSLTETEREQIEGILEWGKITQTGDKSELPFIPVYTLWDLFSSEVDTCLKSRCKYNSECLYQKARRKIFTSELLVVNHHILCADMAIKLQAGNFTSAAFLPVYNRLIVDEAHNLEDVATSYFGKKASRSTVMRNLNLISKYASRSVKVTGGILKRIAERCFDNKNVTPLCKHKLNEAILSLKHERESLESMYEEAYDSLYAYIIKNSDNNEYEKKIRFKGNYSEDADWIREYRTPVSSLVSLIHTLSARYSSILKLLENEKEISREDMFDDLFEFQAYIERLRNCADVYSETIEGDDDGRIKWLKGKRTRKNQIYIESNISPINVAEDIKESMLLNMQTVIFTSATLADDTGFEYLKERLGINLLVHKQIQEDLLPSSFDYKRNCIFFIPSGLPDPADEGFMHAVSQYVHEAAQSFNGRTFVLFTSYVQLIKVKEEISTALMDIGIEVLAQGDEPRSRMLERFRSSGNYVLLGTNSFWEGVDVKGKQLSCLIIVKLPFKVPTEPVHEARSEYLESIGRNSFFEFSLPYAIIKYKQGFGRLIRSSEDRGVFITLDRRLITKNYGRRFIKALPELSQHEGNDIPVL
ncbi:helicase C-terminal domain-containing protein [Spirochaetota bacterium]